MELEVPNKIQRRDLFVIYLEMQLAYLSRKLHKSEDELRPMVMELIQQRWQCPEVTTVVNPSYGNSKLKTTKLNNLLQTAKANIITPSGSIYMPSYQKQSIMSKMVIDMLAERKKIKKLQLKATGAGDDVLAKRCWYKQASIKINCNSMPGGFGSPFNIFYDKGGYNSITSAARCMIARAYTICEQLLGGNFAWFSIEELLNHIMLNLRHRPSDEQIGRCLAKYRLRIPTREELKAFYHETMQRYCPGDSMAAVDQLLDNCTDHEIAFLYYYCNLRHLIWENAEYFRPWIARLMNVDGLELDANATKDDAFKLDDTVAAIVTVAFTDQLGGYGLVDIATDHPEYLPKLVTYGRITADRLHELDDLMETFVNTTADIPMTHLRPGMSRNTTIVSDTDSVIFSAGAWDDWYREGADGLDRRSYQITALVIYWLHHAVKYALKRFSIKFGFIPEQVDRLAMKNEFMFPVMLIYPNKKTYVGLQMIQEGVVFKTPKLDIKGQTLRGSSVCAKSLAFAAELMDRDILDACMKGRINGTELIAKVVAFERHIRDELLKGNVEFLKITSLKYERDYLKPESTSVVVGWKFWETVMTVVYDHIYPPTKVQIFKTLPVTDQYFTWLKGQNPKLWKAMFAYFEQHGQLPNQMVVDPVIGHIPAELIPLVDTRSVVYANLYSVYTTLAQLGISVGGEKLQILFSDIY